MSDLLRMRPLVALILGGLMALAAANAPSGSAADGHTVPCADSIETTSFPFFGSDVPENRYRLVLGVVSVPPAHMQGLAATHEKPWAYWHKQGLVVRAIRGSVTVTVPKGWRRRAAITWGNSGGPISSLRIEGCGAAAGIGHAYAGGFYLRSLSACVPLIFSVGKRTATVRFGLGQSCRA